MKKLGSNEFTYENSYIRPVSVTASNPKHYMAIPGNDKWENMRYCLEKQMGCFKFALPTKVVQNSYVSAVYQYSVIGVRPGTVVTSRTQVYGGDILIVTRHPQPKHLHAYIPPKYWSDLGVMSDAPANTLPDGEGDDEEDVAMTDAAEEGSSNAADTENAKLEALLQKITVQNDTTSTFLPPIVVRILRQHILHPTDYHTLTTPHPMFVCKYCGNQGKHFQTLCPFTETDAQQNSTELITKVRRVVGIPKSRLRAATEEEIALGQYYLNENSEKVVILHKHEESLKPPEPPQKEKVKRTPQVTPQVTPNTVPQDLVVLDVEEYESRFRFNFEDYVEEKDRLEKEQEQAFYEKHPELKKKKNQICTHYYRGMCHKGKLECEFLHTGDENYIAICQFYVNDQCTESNCIFRHPPKHLFNNECNAYKRGFCDKGSLCKYKHIKYRHPSDNLDLPPDVCKAMVHALIYKNRGSFL
jgi:hypothetical protein